MTDPAAPVPKLPTDRRFPWLRAAVLALAALAAACGGGEGELRVLRTIPLPDSVAAGATLAVDSLERAWIGEPGRLTGVDSVGRPLARLAAGGPLAPRVLWTRGERLYVRAGPTLALIDPATRRRFGTRRLEAPVARDPRGRWIYAATGGGGVLGLGADSLAPRWGWPDAGSPVSALAVSALGDRVYVALEGSGRHDVEPAVQVRDAQSGRVLSTFATGEPVRALEPGPDNSLYALSGGDVVALRHGPQGLARLWSTDVTGLGFGGVDALRVSPSGARVAVLSREDGVRVLDARTGAVVGRTKQAPRDAAFDVGGRLWLLYPREIRIAR
ncbi:MAG TPA: hypothetical protein VF746_24310 [Longimicrobium sp.]|jgi:hypothetical protein